MAAFGQSTTFQRRLVRDGLQTAWGFRLQGGKDFNQPLMVQRVFTGSPAEGELQRGDVVIAINNRDTNTLVHKEALEIIKRSGGELLLSIQRGPNRYQAPQQSAPQGYRPVQFTASGPVPASPTKTAGFGVQYGPPSPERQPMINRVQQSLDHAVRYGGPGDEDYEDYDFKPVSQRKAAFQQGSGGGGQRRMPQSRGKKWTPPQHQPVGGGTTFGWGPSVRPDPNYRPGPPTPEPQVEYKPVRQIGPGHDRPAPRSVPAQSFVGSAEMHGTPAWQGSLRKAGSTTPSAAFKSVQFNNQPHGNDVQLNQQQGGVNQGPQVVHLQYNSPLGLYSKNSADSALQGQTAGRDGQGTLMIGGGNADVDLSRSHVYQLIQGGGKSGPQAARYTDYGNQEIHYDGYQDHTQQSRSFQMLQNQVDDGTSEF